MKCKANTPFLMVLFFSYFFLLAGCDDAEPTAPDIDNSGTIIINPSPESLNAPWTLSWADNDSTGLGSQTLTSMTPGEYTLVWGDQPNHITPPNETQALASNNTISFNSMYEDDSFVVLAAGTFSMGSPLDEPEHQDNETLHTITLTQGFYISRYEVTEQLWEEVMGDGLSLSLLPKVTVSWDNAITFCNKLSTDKGLTPAYTIHGPNGNVTWSHGANGYRLPTEAEWEFACRAGSQAAFCNGPITHVNNSPLDPNLDQVGWYGGNSENTLHAVGLKEPNDWGLFDMHGNVFEWVWDGYREDYENLS